MSSGNPSRQPGSNSSTADVLSSVTPLKHKDSSCTRTELPGKRFKSFATLSGSALAPENASAAAAVPSYGKSDQVRRCYITVPQRHGKLLLDHIAVMLPLCTESS